MINTFININILHTDAVITDCILGNGEALDCYNQKLQDAATIEAGLENLKTIQQLVVIESLNNAEEKIDALARLQGGCCGNINDTIRKIAQAVIPLIAASDNTGTPINPIENPPA